MLRRLLWPMLAFLPALGLVVASGPTAGAGVVAREGRASSSASAAAAARAVLSHMRVGQTHPGEPVPGRAPLTGAAESYNWSGYADTNSSGATYTQVAGKWTEPALTCTREDQIAVFWVGIDGWGTQTVEQGGTLAQCFKGTAHYYTWWEMYPTNFIQVVGTSVKPKDAITASVVRSGTSYTIKVTDATTPANSFKTTQKCKVSGGCANASAEWIAEAPGGPRGLYPLPNFHTWSLKGATVKTGTKSGVIKTFPFVKITMIDSSGTYALAQPSGLNTTGNAFTDTWKNSY